MTSTQSTHSDFIVYVDESGDHSLESINPDWPVFVLCFCVFPIDAYINQVTPAIRKLKFETFGHDLVILHEHDILKRKGAFSAMNLPAREEFLSQLTKIIETINMTIVGIVIDKEKHKSKYTTPYHPYHLAMQYGLERINNFLLLNKQTDKTTNIIFEARGKKEDTALELEFRRICDGQNRSKKPLPLTIHIADKKCNCEGLQLADLTARPIGLSVLRPNQANRAWDVIKDKLFTGAAGSVVGNGLKIFP